MRIWRELAYTLTLPLLAAVGLVHLVVVLLSALGSARSTGCWRGGWRGCGWRRPSRSGPAGGR